MDSMVSLFRSFRDGVSLERQRVLWRLLWAATAIKLTLFAAVAVLMWVMLGHIAPDLFRGESADSMRSSLSNFVMMLLMLQNFDFAAAMGVLGPSRLQEAPRRYARMLVNVASARDMNLARPVPIEPDADATPEAQTIGPLAYPTRTLALSDGVYLLGALGGVFLICMGLFVTVATFYPPPSYHQPTTLMWISLLSFPFMLLLLGAVGVLWALVARRFPRMERQGFVVATDADGVTFRLAGRAGYDRRMRWGDAHAFMRIMLPDGMGRSHEVFVLSSADEDMLWEAMYASPSASAEEAQREEAMRVAAHHLAEQVALRTGLPLLDVSQVAYETLGISAAGARQLPWSFFHRARIIAREQGDTAFVSELDRLVNAGNGPVVKAMARLGMRRRRLRNLTPAQRDETLRLARALLPYYPTAAQVTPNPRRRWLKNVYTDFELACQLLIPVVVVYSSVMLFISQ